MRRRSRAAPVSPKVNSVYPDMQEVKAGTRGGPSRSPPPAGWPDHGGAAGHGKTMLAARLPGILPPMTREEALGSAAMQSLGSAGFDAANWKKRPFRAPHGFRRGARRRRLAPRPGEISMALHGVLFLDELPEFDRRVLEVLREPLESGRISVSRAARQRNFRGFSWWRR